MKQLVKASLGKNLWIIVIYWINGEIAKIIQIEVSGEFGDNRPIRSGLVGNQISYKWNNNNLA